MCLAAHERSVPDGLQQKSNYYCHPGRAGGLPFLFITHALEKELSKLEGADSEEEVKKRLRGLGYLS